MKSLMLFIAVYIYLKIDVTCITHISWIHVFMNNCYYFNVYQITILIDSSSQSNFGQSNNFLHRVTQEFPTTLINMKQISVNGTNEALQMPIFENARSSVMYTIVQSEDKQKYYLKYLYNALDIIVKISQLQIKPRFLLILFSNTTSLNRNLRNFLLYTWTLKVLDFSILIVNSKNQAILWNFNPFFNVYNSEYIHSELQIFPDKLSNMNQYPFNIAIYNLKPSLIVRSRNSSTGKQIELDGNFIQFVYVFRNELNFSLSYVNISDQDNVLKLRENLFHKIETGEVQMGPLLCSVRISLYGRKLLFGRPVTNSKRVILVPIITTSKLNFSINMFVNIMVLFSLLLICFWFVASVFRFPKQQWGMLNILALLLGIPQLEPHRLVERMIFFFLVSVSVKFSSEILSTMTDIKLVHEVQNFNSLKDIVQSNMTIYSYFPVQTDFDDDDDDNLKKILSNTKHTRSLHDCILKLLETKKVGCIATFEEALNSLASYSKSDGSPLLKIAKPTFHHDFVTHPHEKASPYLEKYNQILQRVLESRIASAWKYMRRRSRVSSLPNDAAATESMILKPMILIIAVGFTLSTLVFIFEVVYNFHNVRVQVL